MWYQGLTSQAVNPGCCPECGSAAIPCPCDRPADLEVYRSGSLYLLTPRSALGTAWLQEHLEEDAQWFGGSAVVEWRYSTDIVLGAEADGLGVH